MNKFDWTLYKGNVEWLPNRTIFLCRGGSHAYGMNTPTSDEDYCGITIPPKEYFYGYLKTFHQAEQQSGEKPDICIYDIRKFFELASAANPNVLEVLFTDPSVHLQLQCAGEKLLSFRDKFLSKKIRHTFSGFCHSQIKRLKAHKVWMDNPLEVKPSRSDYGLPETTLLPADQLGAIDAVLQVNREIEFPSHVMELYRKERQYQNAKREYDQFQNWKKTRNPIRAEMEKKYGFDLKFASHVVRIARMGEEVLLTGSLNVKRSDAEELLAIRHGAWSYDQFIEFADSIDDKMAEAEKISPLPHDPPRNLLDRLCEELVEDYLTKGG